MNQKHLLPILFIFICLLHCSIRVPEVTVTGEMTALEKQILGTYQQLQDESQLIASSRATSRETQPLVSSEKRKVLQAIKNRKFNQDDIDEFKKLEIVGEKTDGLLEILNPEKMESDPYLQRLVNQVVTEENNDRKIILQRIFNMNENLNEQKKSQIELIFARINFENSNSGTWIQNQDGSWIKKV